MILLFASLSVTSFALFGFDDGNGLNRALALELQRQGFTGRMQSQIEPRLGRPVNLELANIGRLLWFDKIAGLNNDNTCGGCHSPTVGFGDTQSIAIGIENNNIVGPSRKGPRNQRRTPLAINTAFYPKLMWNGRFSANSGDPFDNTLGFTFPDPEGLTLSYQSHLLRAQAFIPPTERVEAAGFHFVGNNSDIRQEVVNRLNATQNYRSLFASVYQVVRNGGQIDYDMFAAAIAEFEFTQVYSNAPIDRFARGEVNAMNTEMKRGGLLFFGKAGCVSCHAVSGQSNEMFSDFKSHVAGIPQIVPTNSNVTFDGSGANEDFGLEQVTGNNSDRYKFRSSPLRNIALQPSFFHNGSITDLKEAIRYHINPRKGIGQFSTRNLDRDLRNPLAPMADVLLRLDPRLNGQISLTKDELENLTKFVGDGLLDKKASSQNLKHLVPSVLPSGMKPLQFQFK